jgi:hypothetical protein
MVRPARRTHILTDRMATQRREAVTTHGPKAGQYREAQPAPGYREPQTGAGRGVERIEHLQPRRGETVLGGAMFAATSGRRHRSTPTVDRPVSLRTTS